MTYRTQKEEEVLKLARKYARMKLFNSYIDEQNGLVTTMGQTDAKDYTELYKTNLLRAAEELLFSMTIDEKEGVLVE